MSSELGIPIYLLSFNSFCYIVSFKISQELVGNNFSINIKCDVFELLWYDDMDSMY